MGQIYDFLAVRENDGADPLRELKTIAQTNPDYRWLSPVVAQTLDEYVTANLGLRPESKQTYNPRDVEENLSEASRLLDSCMAQRREIYDLEAVAVNAALQTMLAEQVQGVDQALAQLQLKAARKQAEAGADDADADVLRKRDRLAMAALKTRLTLHNRSGSALNFGERIAWLRKLYVDNVRSAYLRMYAARIGAFAYYHLTAPEVPAWSSGRDSLHDLVTWQRRIIERLEWEEQFEHLMEAHFTLSTQSGPLAGPAWAPGQFITAVQARETTTIPFAVRDSAFPENEGRWERLVAFGIAPTFDEDDDDFRAVHEALTRQIAGNDANGNASLRMNAASLAAERLRRLRESLTFAIEIVPPEQEILMQGVRFDAFRKVPPVRSCSLSAWTGGPIGLGLNWLDFPRLHNLNPYGEWKLRLQPFARTTIDQQMLDALGIALSGNRRLTLKIKDIHIVMRVASRRASVLD